MLVTNSGNTFGAISGGCLEAELARKSRWVARNGAVIERLSTVFEDTAEMPYGLGCGGTLDLLIEPTNTPEAAALLCAMRDSLAGARRNVVTWLPGNGWALRRAVYDDAGTALFESEAPSEENEVFDEWLEPPQRLFIFGAGDDAESMTTFASLLGWTTLVLDSRSQLARPERFPKADSVTAASSLQNTMIRSEDAVVIMSHSYEQDRRWLTSVLPHHPRYLGLLGSRHRSSLLTSEAATALGWTLDQACDNVFAPVGLDLGGDGAEAIALATIAEIQACCQGKLGHSRRMTPAMIEEQIASGGSVSQYLQTLCAL
jgi:xanthine/CO dehydrogenase XdhC/CoxF family maturation factor